MSFPDVTLNKTVKEGAEDSKKKHNINDNAHNTPNSTRDSSFGNLLGEGDDPFSLQSIATSLHTVKKQQKLEYEKAFNEEYGDELTYLMNKIEFTNQDTLEYMPYIS